MDENAPPGENPRGSRHWKRILLGLFLSPVAAFVASNLVLTLPPLRHWIASKVSGRFHQETTVGGASWAPWAGVSLHDVRILQPIALRKSVPLPLATIDRIQVAPVWRAWLRGRFEVRSITLERPSVILPIEAFAHLSPRGTPPQASPTLVPAPPQTAAASTPSPIPTPSPQAPAAQTPAAPPQAAPPKAAPPAAPPSPATSPATPLIPPQPTGWIHLKNASFQLISTSRPAFLFKISGVSGSIPVSGDPAQARLSLESVALSEHPFLEKRSLELDWKFPVLSLKPLDLEIHGLKYRVAAKIAALQNFPVQLEAQIPKQALPGTDLPFSTHAQAESIAANAGFRGLALEPATWAGDLVFESLKPTIRLGGTETHFDRGSTVTVLRGGLLSCVDARLISDEISVLGNATLLANGNIAAALRLVAPPGNLESLVRNRFPDSGPPRLTPLSTPQRSAFDLELGGSLRQAFLRIGNNGPVVNLKP